MELFHLCLFVTITNVVDCLYHIGEWFFWVNVSLFFHVWTATHILQFPVELSHLILCNCHTMLFHFFCFFLFHIHYPCCEDCHTFLPLSECNCPSFLSVNVTQISWMSLISLSECHTCVSPLSSCECHVYTLVPPLLVSGHSTLFYFES